MNTSTPLSNFSSFDDYTKQSIQKSVQKALQILQASINPSKHCPPL